MFYLLDKQKEIFADDEAYVKSLLYETVRTASIINQYPMLSRILADEELFPILKDVYSKLNDNKSIQLYLRSLRRIEDKTLEARKRELQKILRTRKRELASMA